MQFDTQKMAQSIQAFKKLPDDVKLNIQKSSVRLTNGTFTGSGVFVIDSSGTPGIITAKHNLSVKAGIPTPKEWNKQETKDLIAGFLKNLKISYNDNAAPFDPTMKVQPNKTVEIGPANSSIEFRLNENWDYDLIFIKPPQPLMAYISGHPSRRILYDYKNAYKGELKDQPVYITGYGDVLDASGKQISLTHYFQVRADVVTKDRGDVMREKTPNFYFKEALLISASPKTSTAPGDSGGPVFFVTARNVVYLVGITLGANYDTDKLLPDNPICNNASTSIMHESGLF